MDKELLEFIKASFYGWEYCVEHNLQPTITYEEIELLSNLFIQYEEQAKEIETLRLGNTYLQQRLQRELEK